MQLGQIAFIGGGVMGEAILKSLLASGTATASQIAVGDPVAQRQKDLAERYGIRVSGDNAGGARGADIVVLAVKPQMMGQALGQFRAACAPTALVISIAAGTPIATIREMLHAEQPVVRVMPNTPAQIGMGMSAWTATPNVSVAQLDQTRTILAAMGDEVQVPDEHYIDMATAINGSGPGYVFLILEAMIDAAVRLGFARPVAEKLVLQTVRGSAEYAIQSKQHPALLRNQVTSAGGTTAAGLFELDKGGLRTTLDNAIFAAYHRAVELGQS